MTKCKYRSKSCCWFIRCAFACFFFVKQLMLKYVILLFFNWCAFSMFCKVDGVLVVLLRGVWGY